MRIAIYARVSTKDKGQETENQAIQLREFAAKQDWTVSDEYIDRESGGKGDRIEFQRMFEDASRRKFDLLCFGPSIGCPVKAYSQRSNTSTASRPMASLIGRSRSNISIPAAFSEMSWSLFLFNIKCVINGRF
jgi:Resolvase, N terminal domain